MSSASQSANITRLQVGEIFVKPPNNSTIPPSYILISNGGGSTRWDNVSSILPISSFTSVIANNGTRFNADLSNNTLSISTMAIPSTFNSYFDPLTSTVMLSLAFPPITVNNGSVPLITNTVVVPNPSVISSTSLQSTIRFYGVNDIYFSSVNTTQAVYIGISSFTSAGYSTLNGEMINNPKVSFSSFSTATSIPISQNFISSIPFTNNYDVSMSSITFDATHIANYVNTFSRTTQASLEFYPNFQFPVMVNPGFDYPDPPAGQLGSDQTLIKQVISYIQVNNGATNYIFPETSNLRFMTSQQTINLSNYFSTSYFGYSTTYTPGSNHFNNTIKMMINPYTISSYVGSNLPQSTTLELWHIISSGNYLNDPIAGSNIGFFEAKATNTMFPSNGLFLTINNQITTNGV